MPFFATSQILKTVMKKLLTLVVLLSAMTLTARAQGVHFGVKGGIDVTDMIQYIKQAWLVHRPFIANRIPHEWIWRRHRRSLRPEEYRGQRPDHQDEERSRAPQSPF